MAANISNDIGTWSVTSASNQPDSGDTADIQSDLQAIQSAVKKIRAIGADIASASTVNLAAATGDFVTVTGTTTITAFGTVAAGLRYIIRFSGSLTVTHNGTSLILPSGVSTVVRANDVMIMESLGSGNWRCLAYLPVAKSRVWTDASASRALNVEYTNSNAFEIVVRADYVTSADTTAAPLLFKVGGATVQSCSSVSVCVLNVGPIVVPPGSTYEIETTNDALYTETRWMEYY